MQPEIIQNWGQDNGCQIYFVCTLQPLKERLLGEAPHTASLQEDSAPTHRGMSLAGLFFSETKTYIIGPKKGGPEAKLNAENQLFQRLDTMLPREHIKVQPGKLVFAVYNDNW